MEKSNESVKCSKCDEEATIFITVLNETEGSGSQLAYCNKHGHEDGKFGAWLPDLGVCEFEMKKEFEEVLDVFRSSGKVSIDSVSLPSGARNPFYGRADAALFTAEDIQGLIDELDVDEVDSDEVNVPADW